MNRYVVSHSCRRYYTDDTYEMLFAIADADIGTGALKWLSVANGGGVFWARRDDVVRSREFRECGPNWPFPPYEITLRELGAAINAARRSKRMAT